MQSGVKSCLQDALFALECLDGVTRFELGGQVSSFSLHWSGFWRYLFLLEQLRFQQTAGSNL